ncbi:auxilin-like clathrin-binding protein required for normal clathrin function [Recurvomyces mirabilis]|uniref:Auxilin-like clathrin-binding protein required for normal clathrin function n=1 Tax=Recurvomyces mirabilis TaxID=574656 RepID=A0AAE0WX29_9PEZI|nr:auxilin-like clathrin-binding protein required for normal clathrin function [Recurvomyces mirabilis]KAK5161750.1 auxilin-like clathrin-binding protein required for normal clathrin function [Recurvomyces mirabilis]
MDDLLGEDWQAPAKPTNKAPNNPAAFASTYSSYRASPMLQPSASGSASPQTISRPSSTVNNAPKTGVDSFGSLLGNKAQKPSSSTLSIQDRQRQLVEEKRRQQEQQSQLWDTLGSGRGTPEVRATSPAPPHAQEDVDDILAAFNKDAPVDRASHMSLPVSSTATSGRNTPVTVPYSQSFASHEAGFEADDDDDPFGLAAKSGRGNGHTIVPAQHVPVDDDDILGDLGKPAVERPQENKASEPPPRRHDLGGDGFNVSHKSTPGDSALAELVDMGFSADAATIALSETGGDVQDAVGYLLQQAHEESKQKARSEAQATRQRSPVHGGRSPMRSSRGEHSGGPAYMRDDERSTSAARRQDSRSPANGEKDASQVAQELGNKLFKGANSLWKASQKQMAKTMSDFQQERDASQPKWMQEPSPDTSRASSQRRQPPPKPTARKPPVDVTDEAAMLDTPREPQFQKPTRSQDIERVSDLPHRGRSPVETLQQRSPPQSRFVQQPVPQQDKRPPTKLRREEVEDQTGQAYVSPARRKRPTPQPTAQPQREVDLFSPAPVQAPAPTPPVVGTRQAPSVVRSAPAIKRPSAPPRDLPPVSPSALAMSAKHRKAGGESFKRGDYAAAHGSYTAALTPLPATHPITIIVLTNRSLTGLKTGEAKTAVVDADRALEIIGSSQGVGETIDLGGEGLKDMRDFYGKAVMRKAEALEHMEKWTDGAAAWRQAIEAGVGGAVSLRGRDRCEKAANPKAAAATTNGSGARPPAKKAPPARPLGNSLNRPTLTSPSSAAAVTKLRDANAAAEKADDEKFALIDQVDARLTAWKGSKADNLRALLQSLDNVLWEGAGWKKVGMSDLVMPNKVKIVYMKAIGKVHPDKIPQDATTEQRMVSAAVFSTLNEAWDKFKTDNKL